MHRDRSRSTSLTSSYGGRLRRLRVVRWRLERRRRQRPQIASETSKRCPVCAYAEDFDQFVSPSVGSRSGLRCVRMHTVPSEPNHPTRSSVHILVATYLLRTYSMDRRKAADKTPACLSCHIAFPCTSPPPNCAANRSARRPIFDWGRGTNGRLDLLTIALVTACCAPPICPGRAL